MTLDEATLTLEQMAAQLDEWIERKLSAVRAERDEARAEVSRLQRQLGEAVAANLCHVSMKQDALLSVALDSVADQRDRLATDALAALAGAGICTPEEGYVKAPHCLSSNIADLARERDRARAELAESRARLAMLRDLLAEHTACAGDVGHPEECLREIAALAETADAGAWLNSKLADESLRTALHIDEGIVDESKEHSLHEPIGTHLRERDARVRAAALAAVLKALESFGALCSECYEPARKALTEALR